MQRNASKNQRTTLSETALTAGEATQLTKGQAAASAEEHRTWFKKSRGEINPDHPQWHRSGRVRKKQASFHLRNLLRTKPSLLNPFWANFIHCKHTI